MTDVKCPENMVYIPAGTFRMGSTNGDSDEQPVRDIYVSAFCMDKHEVTNAEYSSYKKSPSPRGFDGPNQPVVNVAWREAKAFCRAKGKRLPTEAEWEKAARGPEGYGYGTRSGRLNSDEAYHYANNTADVCSYPENGYGLCDMTGNVWEWVSDWYDGDAYSSMESRDPDGPSKGWSKVIRGGARYRMFSWFVYWDDRINRCGPDCDFDDYGFRCVSDPVKSEE